jgi:signal transduction histidine kinase
MMHLEEGKLLMLNVLPILIVMTAIHAQTTYAKRTSAKIAPIEIPAMTAMPVRRAINALRENVLAETASVAMTAMTKLKTAAIPPVDASIIPLKFPSRR